jgi:uncharacterized protein YecE (DUF72 family)
MSEGDDTGRVLVGCSGWQYRDWRGSFYPGDLAMTKWFGYYADRFPTVELNSTFYRLPTTASVDRWSAAAPEGFVYAVKLGAFGTHRKKLRDPESWLPEHLDRVEHLGASAGPTLVQLPPNWRRDVPRLDDFLAATPPDRRWAIELRDPSWIHDDVFSTLQKHGAALCLHDLLPDLPRVRTTDWTYVRLHGPRALAEPYHGRYGSRRLRALAGELREAMTAGDDAYVYFNNDQEAAAPRDALWLARELGISSCTDEDAGAAES